MTESMPAARSLALGIGVDVGLRHERATENGIAHLIEHLVFGGTSNRDAGQIAQAMDLAGGQVGAFTARDYTCYVATVLDEHGPYALDLFGDLLLNPTFPAESLRHEHQAVLCELAARRDSPGDRAQDLLKEFAWADHPLGRPIAGRPETLAPITREDLIYFFHGHYVPDRMVIAAAGNIDHDDFVAQARDAFWRLLGEAVETPTTPAGHRGGVILEHLPVGQAYFCLGVPAPAYGHADRYAVHLLDDLLGGGISSRLNRRLREEAGLVYAVGSEYQAYRDGGLLTVSGSTTPENLQAVLAATLIEMWQLALGQRPLTEEEVWRSRTRIRRQYLLAGEDSSTRMSRLLTQELYFGRHISADEVLAHIESFDAPTLERFTEQYLPAALGSLTLAVIGPEMPAAVSVETLEELCRSFA